MEYTQGKFDATMRLFRNRLLLIAIGMLIIVSLFSVVGFSLNQSDVGDAVNPTMGNVKTEAKMITNIVSPSFDIITIVGIFLIIITVILIMQKVAMLVPIALILMLVYFWIQYMGYKLF